MLRDLALRILLLPVLVGQAIFVIARIPKLPEATGPRSGLIGKGPRLRLLVVGDSSAAGVGARTQDDALLGQVLRPLSAQYTVDYTLIAQTGATTKDALGWMQQRPMQNYDVVVCALGGNDVTKGTSRQAFLQVQTELHDFFQSECGAQLLVVSALPPVGHFPSLPQPLRWALGARARAFDQGLQALIAQRSGCARLEFDLDLDVSAFASDGFHPGPPAYAAWGQRASTIILESPLRLDDAATAP